jgi:hypothetical protein
MFSSWLPILWPALLSAAYRYVQLMMERVGATRYRNQAAEYRYCSKSNCIASDQIKTLSSWRYTILSLTRTKLLPVPTKCSVKCVYSKFPQLTFSFSKLFITCVKISKEF